MTDNREMRGKAIAEKPNQIQRLDDRFYRVASQSRDLSYDVVKKKESSGWLCTCPDFQHRNVQCKHIWAVQFSLKIRQHVQARVIEPMTDIHACLFCKAGNMKYVYAMMDEQTRFWIAQEVADTKYTADVRPLFQLAKQIAGKQPRTLVTDGAANFHGAYNQEFRTLKLETRTEHIRHIRLAGDFNNNKMERMNGEIRDREKVMRGLERKDSPILTGYQLFHNYVRPHMALKGKTPAEAAGIEIKGENRWLTIIQNARKEKIDART